MPLPYSTVDQVRNYCNLINGQNSIETASIEFYIEEADNRVEIDLKAVIDTDKLRLITVTPAEVNKLSIFKAVELVLIGNGIMYTQNKESESSVNNGYAYEYNKLLKLILDGRINVENWSDYVSQSNTETSNYYEYPSIIEEIEDINDRN